MTRRLPRFLLSLDFANYVIARTATGDIIQSRKPESWQDFFELMMTVDVPENFLADRKDMPQIFNRPQIYVVTLGNSGQSAAC